MNCLRTLLLLAYALLLVGCSLTTATEQTVRVGVIGDQTGATDRTTAYAVLDKAVQRLAGERLAVVLHTGDLVESRVDDALFIADFEHATKVLGRLPVRWYLAAGDHDVSPQSWDADSTDRRREALFRDLYGKLRSIAKDRLYYSFDEAGYHFVALYTHETLNVDPRWGTILLAGISADQVKWLAEDLDRHRNARGIVVFLHQPLWYAWPRWSAVHALLRRYPVIAVIAGHFHYNQDDGVLDGIRYVTVGATGGNTKRGAPRAGDLQHVTVVTLRGRDASFSVLPLNGEPPTSLTPRLDMDRVQMLDLVLDALGSFETTNPVFRKGAAFVSDCRTGAPARIALVPLGNPLDVPLDVTVRLATPGVTFASAGFSDNACVTTTGAEQCQLGRGARLKTANFSTIDFTWGCGFCELPPPLWSAIPVLADPGKIPEQLGLDVRLSFQGASGELFLQRGVSTKIQSCP